MVASFLSHSEKIEVQCNVEMKPINQPVSVNKPLLNQCQLWEKKSNISDGEVNAFLQKVQ